MVASTSWGPFVGFRLTIKGLRAAPRLSSCGLLGPVSVFWRVFGAYFGVFGCGWSAVQGLLSALDQGPGCLELWIQKGVWETKAGNSKNVPGKCSEWKDVPEIYLAYSCDQIICWTLLFLEPNVQ